MQINKCKEIKSLEINKEEAAPIRKGATPTVWIRECQKHFTLGVHTCRRLHTDSAWSPDYAFGMIYYILLYVIDIF